MKSFEDWYHVFASRTLVPKDNCELLWREAQGAILIGDFAEVGVYKGGTAQLFNIVDPSRRLHLFDTFAGHPAVQTSADDAKAHPPRRFAGAKLDEILERLDGRVIVWPGIFPLTLEAQPYRPKLALVHVDADLYWSTYAALRVLVPCVIRDGVVIIDDYSTDDCPGAKLAVDEYLADDTNNVALEVASTGQAVLRKVL